MPVPPVHPWWPGFAPTWAHPHVIFEVLAYAVGFQTFLALRRRSLDPVRAVEHRGWIVAAAAVGASLGARALFWFEDPAQIAARIGDPTTWGGGRTIVGGLLGGWLAVEVAKKALGIRYSTGDIVVAPLIAGTALGRVGCFFSGVSDGTHGAPTPFGLDHGDGVLRHPTALYEIGFVLAWGALLWATRGTERFNGDRWLRFISGYLGFRLVVEAWKTQPFPYFGLSAIQIACLLGLAVSAAWLTVPAFRPQAA